MERIAIGIMKMKKIKLREDVRRKDKVV